MDEFFRTINGLDLVFTLNENSSQYTYLVETSNYHFTIKLNNGKWRIQDHAPSCIMEIEEKLGDAIDGVDHNKFDQGLTQIEKNEIIHI
jgi:inorganic pyrophosphatase/exopolyphosphatase